jgi:hypothetical protein
LKKEYLKGIRNYRTKKRVKTSGWNARADYAVLENRSDGEQVRRLYNVGCLREERKVLE